MYLPSSPHGCDVFRACFVLPKITNVIAIIFVNLVQPDQINMAVLFSYLVKSDASVCYCTYSSLHWTSRVLQGIITTRSCINGHPVILL